MSEAFKMFEVFTRAKITDCIVLERWKPRLPYPLDVIWVTELLVFMFLIFPFLQCFHRLLAQNGEHVGKGDTEAENVRRKAARR